MNEGRTIFAQLNDALPKHEFDRCVARYYGNRRVRSMSCYDQYLIMMFAQLTCRESLRDIAVGLQAQATNLYHSGIRSAGARSTLADANEKRAWRIFAGFAQVLIQQACALYAGEDFGIELEQTAHALDSTTIDLCLSLFPWAKFRRAKSAVKLHTLLALQGNYPTVVIITPGKVHDVNILDEWFFDAGSFYFMDRGYLDSTLDAIGFTATRRFSSHEPEKPPAFAAATPNPSTRPADCGSIRPSSSRASAHGETIQIPCTGSAVPIRTRGCDSTFSPTTLRFPP